MECLNFRVKLELSCRHLALAQHGEAVCCYAFSFVFGRYTTGKKHVGKTNRFYSVGHTKQPRLLLLIIIIQKNLESVGAGRTGKVLLIQCIWSNTIVSRLSRPPGKGYRYPAITSDTLQGNVRYASLLICTE